jgi:hypothetical protein
LPSGDADPGQGADQSQQYDDQSFSHHEKASQLIHMTGRTVALDELWTDAVAVWLGEAAVGTTMAAPITMRRAPVAGKLIRTVVRVLIHPRFERDF